MERTGTITELSPQDGLGWITLDDGELVRFGGTVAHGVTLEIGRRVRVLGTAVGYRGVVKATAVVELAPASGPLPAAPQAQSRRYLADLEGLGIPIDPALRAIVARADVDDAFFKDLEQVMFELGPMPAEALDCHAPAFFVIAMNGGGSAYGVYIDPSAPGEAPWVYWEHEDDTLHFVARDTVDFFARFLDHHASWVKADVIGRLRAALAELGLRLSAPAPSKNFHEGMPADWLPELH